MGGWRAKLVLVVMMLGGVASAHTIRALQDFLAIGNALEAFKIHAGRYPTEDEGLEALVERPPGLPHGSGWQQVMLKIPSDPWGKPYFYITSPSPGEDFGLYSVGRDGVSHSKGNDPDDWNTWSEELQEEYDRRDTWKNWLKKNAVPFSLAMVMLALAVAAAIRATRMRSSA